MPFSIDRGRRSVSRGLATFLVGLGAVAAVNCAARSLHSSGPPGTPESALPPVSDSVRDLTADQQVQQALNRLTFGARPGDAARVRAMGVDRWIAQQLAPQRISDRATDELVARFPAYSEPIDELEAQLPDRMQVLAARRGVAPASLRAGGAGAGAPSLTPDDSMALRDAARASERLVTNLQTLKVARALMSERQLQEVMVDFWENHFTVYDRKGQRMRYYLAAYDRDAIRPYAMGKFRDLLGAVAKSPAMLFYLDNWESVADSTEPTLEPRRAPRRQQLTVDGSAESQMPRRRALGLNENYGRELLELHTLGVDGGYSQRDVIDVARALTGWSIARPREIMQGTGGFVFRPQSHDAGSKVVLGHELPAGRGIEDGDAVLDIIARNPSTARFVATKLCRRFVSDTPPSALVARATATFTRTDGDIHQVLWTILTSPEFFSRDAYRAKVKSPFELVVSALRSIDAQPDTTPRTARVVAQLGEPLFGHQAPNGYPETGASWMNTGAILNRINFGLAIAANRIPGATLDRWPEATELASAPRAQQVDAVIAEILGGAVSPDTRAILLSGDHPLLSNSVARDDGDSAAPPVRGLAQVIGLALGAPEFQRR